MARRRSPRTEPHHVTFTAERREIGKTPLKIIARKGNRRVGRLFIGRGGVGWYPRYAKLGYELSWEEFARQMAKP